MNLSNTRILVTNDDGISAPGLVVMENIANALSKDVWVVAPETEQSGVAHSLTLHVPVRLRKSAERRYAISGTPTDCVLLALNEIIPQAKNSLGRQQADKPVGLVLSGVNRGSNVGDDVTYSGTIAAAMEGTILDVPSIAFSQLYDDRDNVPWDTAEAHAPTLIKQLMASGWPKNTLININFPKCGPKKVKGVRVCPQGKRLINVGLFERVDPKGRPYFWIGGDRDDKADAPGVDIELLNEGYITVTPLTLDLTDYATLQKLQLEISEKAA